MDPVTTLQDDRGEDDEMREHNKKKQRVYYGRDI